MPADPTPPLTRADLGRLRELDEAATPGPWRYCGAPNCKRLVERERERDEARAVLSKTAVALGGLDPNVPTLPDLAAAVFTCEAEQRKRGDALVKENGELRLRTEAAELRAKSAEADRDALRAHVESRRPVVEAAIALEVLDRADRIVQLNNWTQAVQAILAAVRALPKEMRP